MSDASLTVLVTGANAGVGLETCAQLAAEPTIGCVILACRSQAKAEAAVEGLVARTGKPAEFFRVLLLDVADRSSVEHAVTELASASFESLKIDMLLLNAGGMGTELGLEPATGFGGRCSNVMASNTVGHVLLFERLLARNLLTSNAVVVYSSSEIARGLATMASKPKFDTSTNAAAKNCLLAHLQGNPPGGYKRFPSFMFIMSAYSAAKAVGTLYFQHAAAEHAGMRILAVSPGGCHSTNAHLQGPRPMKGIYPLSMRMASFIGMSQSPGVGAKRYTDALFGRAAKSYGAGICGGSSKGDAQATIYATGRFVASRMWASGRVADQGASYPELYANAELQKAAAEAVRDIIEA